MARKPRKILFVFTWLVVGGEETEVRLLAKHLDRSRFNPEVFVCMHRPEMPEQSYKQLASLGVPIDNSAVDLSFEDTVRYLADKLRKYDLVVACQEAPDVLPALEMLRDPPPLIEHGGLVREACFRPKHLTARYIGVCASIRDAAVQRMPERPHHAVEIPSMVDLSEFDPGARQAVRAEWGIDDDVPIVGFVGRLDRKKRTEDFILAAAILSKKHDQVRFVVIGGPDAFMTEYVKELRALRDRLELHDRLTFLGDQSDVPRLLSGLDVLVWLSRHEGMPHVISEAGAACLPVVATPDNGSIEQIIPDETGLLVPHRNPERAASAVERLLLDPSLRRRLGQNLRLKVEREYSTDVLVPRWEKLMEEVIAEKEGGGSPVPSRVDLTSVSPLVKSDYSPFRK
ncbi:MAG: glycosyltransferase family 4 protein [Rudaea sp.]